jgi:hypothetical protein
VGERKNGRTGVRKNGRREERENRRRGERPFIRSSVLPNKKSSSRIKPGMTVRITDSIFKSSNFQIFK